MGKLDKLSFLDMITEGNEDMLQRIMIYPHIHSQYEKAYALYTYLIEYIERMVMSVNNNYVCIRMEMCDNLGEMLDLNTLLNINDTVFIDGNLVSVNINTNC